jgi:hypothetical protein
MGPYGQTSQLASAICASFALSFASAPPTIADETVEPPLIVEIQVGDVQLTLPVGGSGAIEINDKSYAVKVVPKATRTLELSNLNFDYPREFKFEYETSPAKVGLWTLKGAHTVIMLYRYPAEMGDLSAAYTKGALERRSGAKTTEEDVELKLTDRTLSGKHLVALIKDKYSMSADVFGWTDGSHGLALILQDTLDSAGQHTREYDEAIRLLKASYAETPIE